MSLQDHPGKGKGKNTHQVSTTLSVDALCRVSFDALAGMLAKILCCMTASAASAQRNDSESRDGPQAGRAAQEEPPRGLLRCTHHIWPMGVLELSNSAE